MQVMQRKLFTALVFVVLAFLIYFFVDVPFSKKHIITIRGASLEVEVANTSYLRKAGLMGRQYLDMDKGMLFVFPQEDIQAFWMKNTLIPLSIAFIKANGKIIQIAKMTPDKWDGKLANTSSKEKAKYALEVNQGWFEQNGIREGDAIHFSRSIKKLSVE